MEDLPDPVLVKILHFFELRQLAQLRLICKKFCCLAPLANGSYLDVEKIVGPDHPALLQNLCNDYINYSIVRKNLNKISQVLSWLETKIRILTFKNRLFEYAGGLLAGVLPNVTELRVDRVGSNFWVNNARRLGKIEILEVHEFHPESFQNFPRLKQLFAICTFDAPDKIQLNLSEWKVLDDQNIDHDDPDAEYSLDFFADDSKFDRSKFAFIEEFPEKSSDSEEEEEEEEEEEDAEEKSENEIRDPDELEQDIDASPSDLEKSMKVKKETNETSKSKHKKYKKLGKSGVMNFGNDSEDSLNFGNYVDSDNFEDDTEKNDAINTAATPWEALQSSLESKILVHPLADNLVSKMLEMNHISVLDSNVATSILKQFMSGKFINENYSPKFENSTLKAVKHFRYEASLSNHEITTHLLSKLISHMPEIDTMFLSCRLETLSCLDGEIAEKLISLELHFCSFVDVSQAQLSLSQLTLLKSLKWSSDLPMMVDWAFLQSYHDLERLEIDRFDGVEKSMHPKTFRILPQCAPLKYLKLGGTLAGCDMLVNIIKERSYNLEEFHCRPNLDDDATIIFFGGRQFKGLASEAAGKLLEICSNLADFDLLQNEYISDLFIDYVAGFGKSLRRLNLRGTSVTYRGLLELAKRRHDDISWGGQDLPRLKICVDQKLCVKPSDCRKFELANLYINPIFVKKCKLHRYTYTFTIVEQS